MKRRHQLEKHLYRLLGVETFRRLVFLLERFVHRKDHGRNDNYHIRSFTQGALEDFVKYLFYNGSIHVRNILILLIYFIVKIVLHVPLRWYDTFALLLGLKDVFCVMLQRYNYLRILERKQKLDARYQIHIQRRVSELRKSFCASCEGIRRFGFKRSFFLSSVIKDCEKIDLIRHEYAHFIVDAARLERYFEHGCRRTSHGSCWKFAYKWVGAMPTRSHDSSAFSNMNLSSEKIQATFLATDVVQFDIRSFLKKWNRVPTDEEIFAAPSSSVL